MDTPNYIVQAIFAPKANAALTEWLSHIQRTQPLVRDALPPRTNSNWLSALLTDERCKTLFPLCTNQVEI